ncbi:glyoxalase [Subtercola sp. Z020]|uniref:VOC family protein n=1 Tax=Subtercola sp. Z020 TaxID=2080582 RepID=UPI000CE73367|nr:VOC family protein [Subtercola sp. Z020]PPF78694.1 glyoxalase [Subtercola sp. Z020]
MTATPAPGVWPSLRFRDAAAALGWLVDTIGFTEHAVYRGDAVGDPERDVAHAELLWPGGGGIMLGSDTGSGWAGSAGGPGTATTYLSADDPRPVFERVDAAGWTIIRPLTEQSYGGSEFAFLDPEGNAWSVGSYRGENL